MKALVCSTLGSVDDLELQQLPDPEPADDEVVVDIQAASLNFPDILIVEGKYQIRPNLPFVAGGEGAGTVSRIGRNVRDFGVGDRVAVLGSTGAFAEKIVKKEGELIRVPDSMDFDTAAGFSVAYGTSFYALKQCGKLQSGETVLVLGAAGGVGLAAVDIATAMGASVIAAASDDEKLAVAASVGAVAGIRYDRESVKERTKELTDGRGVDVVVDPVGGDASEQALRAIAWNGRLLVVGFAAGDIPRVPLNLPLLKNCSINGVFFGAWAQREPRAYADNFTELFCLFDRGLLHPVVSDTFSLEDYMAGFRVLSERRAKGKVVLCIGDKSE